MDAKKHNKVSNRSYLGRKGRGLGNTLVWCESDCVQTPSALLRLSLIKQLEDKTTPKKINDIFLRIISCRG